MQHMRVRGCWSLHKNGEKLHLLVLNEEADGLSDSAADEVGGVTEEDGAVVLAGAT